MIINGIEIIETEVLAITEDGTTFTINNLINFILENAEAIKKTRARIHGKETGRWSHSEPWLRPDEQPDLKAETKKKKERRKIPRKPVEVYYRRLRAEQKDRKERKK